MDDIIITGGEMVIEYEIDGEKYMTTLWVDSDMTDEQLNNIKSVAIKGFKEIHKQRLEQENPTPGVS